MGQSEQSELRRLLTEEWADECELVGPRTLDDIVVVVQSGGDEKQFIAAQGGANFSAPEVLSILVQCATLVHICIAIWKDWRSAGRNPGRSAFVQEVLAKGALNLPSRVQTHIEALYGRLQW